MSLASSESLFDKPRASSGFSQTEMATIANFCQDPAGVTCSDNDGATNDATTTGTAAHGCVCQSPVQPSSFFSISVMEQAEHGQLEMLHPSELGSDDTQSAADKARRPGLTRTESIKAWFGALSHEKLLQTALEKLKLEDQGETVPSYAPRWHKCMDDVDGVAWVDAFSVLDTPAESATKFMINISDSESDSDANSFVSARSASSTSSSCYATPIHSVESMYHRAPHGKKSDKSGQVTADGMGHILLTAPTGSTETRNRTNAFSHSVSGGCSSGPNVTTQGNPQVAEVSDSVPQNINNDGLTGVAQD